MGGFFFSWAKMECLEVIGQSDKRKKLKNVKEANKVKTKQRNF